MNYIVLKIEILDSISSLGDFKSLFSRKFLPNIPSLGRDIFDGCS
jgi:hypothetical protein